MAEPTTRPDIITVVLIIPFFGFLFDEDFSYDKNILSYVIIIGLELR